MNVLVVEDGTEYIETLTRFVASEARWERVGDAASALERLAAGGVDVVFLDMRFDRVPDAVLLGDVAAVSERFAGDYHKAIRFLQENQGALILTAIRAAGHRVPVLFSYNFDEEPRRWARLQQAQGPVGYVPDSESPMGVVSKLRSLIA